MWWVILEGYTKECGEAGYTVQLSIDNSSCNCQMITVYASSVMTEKKRKSQCYCQMVTIRVSSVRV